LKNWVLINAVGSPWRFPLPQSSERIQHCSTNQPTMFCVIKN